MEKDCFKKKKVCTTGQQMLYISYVLKINNYLPSVQMETLGYLF